MAQSMLLPSSATPSLDRAATRPRRSSLTLPDTLKLGDDAHEDVTAPETKEGRYINQPFLSMIANIAANPNFDSDLEAVEKAAPGEDVQMHGAMGRDEAANGNAYSQSVKIPQKVAIRGRKAGQKSSSTKVLSSREISGSPSFTLKEDMNSSQILDPRRAGHDYRLDDMGPDQPEVGECHTTDGTQTHDPSVGLDDRLAQIFGFEQIESVVSDFPCWFMQSVLLEGHMYITPKHACFYAYLPKSAALISKSGYLSKSGRQDPRYNRMWFTLKANVLSYYSNKQDVYFPRGTVDLRHASSAENVKKRGTEETSEFRIATPARTHHFRADSTKSATEWVKQIQKAIFRAHNDSDSVKICLPIDNILDIEESPVLDFTYAFKIRIIDNDETYAIDEYFFSFFRYGQDALEVLRQMVDERTSSPHKELPREHTTRSRSGKESVIPRDHDNGTSAESHESESSDSQGPSSRAYKSRAQSEMPGHVGPESDISKNENDRNVKSEPQTEISRSATSLLENEEFAPTIPHDSLPPNSTSPSAPDSESSSDDQPILQTESVSASQILQRSDLFNQPLRSRKRYRGRNLQASMLCHENQQRQSSKTPVQTEFPLHRTSTENSWSKNTHNSSEEEKTSDTQKNEIDTLRPSPSSNTMRDLASAGSHSWQRATGLADLVKAHSMRVGSSIAAGSKVYYEKVNGMWAGEQRHYDEAEELASADPIEEAEDGVSGQTHGARFRSHFSLPDSEKLRASYHGYLCRVVASFGKIYLGTTKLCFRSLLPGSRTKMVLPLKDIETVEHERGFHFGYSGLVVVVRGHDELFFEFSKASARDDLIITLLKILESRKDLSESSALAEDEKLKAEMSKAEYELLEHARRHSISDDSEFRSVSLTDDYDNQEQPVLFDDLQASMLNFKPSTPQRITCLTIGSRGDVQPYIALCKALKAEGHQTKIATHAEFEPWIREHGIDFASVAGDPRQIMRLCVENDMFSKNFIQEARAKFSGWIDDLLHSAWVACEGSEILIESPSAMAGIHIAEALQIPYFRAFSMPWTRTRAYPHAFAVPSQKMGGYFNALTYTLIDTVLWTGIRTQVNRWRGSTLGLPPTSPDKIQFDKRPFMYSFSPSLVPQPLDFNHWIKVVGYWFLDEGDKYQPPDDLGRFIKKARDDQKKLVYVGFGSMVIESRAKMTQAVIEGVKKADVRCIWSKGWSERLETDEVGPAETETSDSIFYINSAPHDWLFKQIDAAVHHGGAGTVGESLRAGLPTVVKPFFGDQYFFGQRVEDLGVGKCLRQFNGSTLAAALWEVTHDERTITKASRLGARIRAEDGVGTAIQNMYRDLEYAKLMVTRHRAGRKSEEQGRKSGDQSRAPPAMEQEQQRPVDESGDSWTLVDEDSDFDSEGRSQPLRRAQRRRSSERTAR